MTHYFEDHGLPLVQLKEQRRDLIVALMGRRPGPIAKNQIGDIATIQQAIAAIEAVVVDLDAEAFSIVFGGPNRQLSTARELFASDCINGHDSGAGSLRGCSMTVGARQAGCQA